MNYIHWFKNEIEIEFNKKFKDSARLYNMTTTNPELEQEARKKSFVTIGKKNKSLQ